MRKLFPFAAALLLISPAALRSQSAPSTPATPAPASPAATPAPADKKAEAPPKIEGIELARAGGGYLGIKTEGVTLKVTFYDAKKKKTPADAVRIAARWHDNRLRRTVLLPASTDTLVSPSVISRPFNYIIFLVLIGADDNEIESFSLNLNGSG